MFGLALLFVYVFFCPVSILITLLGEEGPGAVARSDARLPGMRTVAGSILTSGKPFFR